jgi:hypothetical protein
MRARLGAATLLMSVFVGPTGTVAAAQDESSSRAAFTPYGWFFGMAGRLGAGDSAFDIDLSPGEAIEQADLAFSLVLEGKRGRWFGRFDGTFVSSSARQDVQGTAADVVVELDQGIFEPDIGYEAVVAPWGGVDLFAGARIWRLKLDAETDEDDPVRIASGDRIWTDGIGGVRLRYNPAPKWRLFARGDAGAGGSNLTWQAVGGAGFDFSDCCGAVLAYRHLDVEYNKDAVLNDTRMSGFALGLEIRF